MHAKLACNWVCLKFAEAKTRAGKNGDTKGSREKLVQETKIKFDIEGKFNVPRTTINSHIKADKLVVFNTGVSSPVLDMKPFFVALIISAWECNYHLTVGECIIMAANNL